MAGGAQGAGAPQFKGQNFLNNLQSYGQQGGNLSQLQNSPYAGQLAQQLQNAQSNQQKFRQSQTLGQAQQQPTYGVSTDWAQNLINSQQPAQGSMGSTNPTPYQAPQGQNMGGPPPPPGMQWGQQPDGSTLNWAMPAMYQGPAMGSLGQTAQNWANFSPQSPMGGFPQQPQGAGPDVTGNSPAANMGYDQSGSDAGIGGQAVLGVQSPIGGVTSRAGGPPNFSQMRPQRGGLQVQGNPTMQQFIRGQRMR